MENFNSGFEFSITKNSVDVINKITYVTQYVYKVVRTISIINYYTVGQLMSFEKTSFERYGK